MHENKFYCNCLLCTLHFICFEALLVIVIINFIYNQFMSILQDD